MYQTAFGRHGDRTRTAQSSARTNHARYHCAVRPVVTTIHLTTNYFIVYLTINYFTIYLTIYKCTINLTTYNFTINLTINNFTTNLLAQCVLDKESECVWSANAYPL